MQGKGRRMRRRGTRCFLDGLSRKAIVDVCVESFVVSGLGAVADWAGPGMLLLLLLLLLPRGFSGVIQVVQSFVFAANLWRLGLEVLQFLAELFDLVHFVFAFVSRCFFKFAFGPDFPFVLAAFFETGRVG